MNPIFRSGSVLGSIDAPDGHATVLSGRMTVTGWALGVSSPVSRVEVRLGGRLEARAGLYRMRPDIAAALGDGAAELSGFEFGLGLRRIEHVGDGALLGARVTLLDGTSRDLPEVKLKLGPRLNGTAPSSEQAATRQGAGVLRQRGRGERGRLLCVARGLDQGGSQLRLREFVAHFRAAGKFDITVMSPIDGPLRHDLEAQGALVMIAPVPLDDVSAYEERLASITSWAAGRFDVVMASTLTSFSAIDLAERLGLPSVWRIGEAEPLHTVVEWLGGSLDPEVEQRAHRAFGAASVVFFNSEASLDVCRRNGLDGQFAVLGSGTDVAGAHAYVQTSERSAVRQELGVSADRRLLVCAGTIWPIKGQALLISALKHVVTDQPRLECVLIGLSSAEPYTQSVRRLIERHGLARSVRLLPFADDLRPWWRAADAAVCPSESESMPASVLEAMSFGLPALACRAGGVPEVVKDGSTGWLCESCDLESLITGLSRVAMAKPEELRALGENAAWSVHAGHDRPTALARIADVIESLSRGSRPRWLIRQLGARQESPTPWWRRWFA